VDSPHEGVTSVRPFVINRPPWSIVDRPGLLIMTSDGRGIRLWDDLRGLESGYQVTAETAENGTTHLTFRR